MIDTAAMLTEFHDALGQPFGHGDIADSTLRIKLHREETKELIEALRSGDRVATAQELADVVYVAYGTAHSLGLELDPAAVTVKPIRADFRFSGDTLSLVLYLLTQDLCGTARALAELIADAYVTARELDIPLDAVIIEVHRANLRKFGPDGPVLRFDGKLLKPPGWAPPDVAAVLERSA